MPARAAALPGRRCSRHVLMALLVALLAGCAASQPLAAPGRLSGGTATVALQPGDQFSWILRGCRAETASPS